MPAITSLDLSNAKLDVDHIAAIATSTNLTATDRLGHVKDTISGAVYKITQFTDKGAWATATSYSVKDLVSNSGTWYVAVVAHTSGATFAGDVSTKWRVYQGVTSSDLAAPSGASMIGESGGQTQEVFNTELKKANNDLYLISAFKNTDSKMYLFNSRDGVTFDSMFDSYSYAPPTGVLRDPCITFVDGVYWACYSNTPSNGDFNTQFFGVAKSKDLITWQHAFDVNKGVINTWAPEWFIDVDGSVYVIVALNFDTHLIPINLSTGTAGTQFSLGIPGQSIDGTLQYDNGTYYLFVKNETTKYIERYESSALTGTWVKTGSGDWAGWGLGIEGPCLVRQAGFGWRIYFDSYGTSEYFTSTSATLSSNSWSAKQTTTSTEVLRHLTVIKLQQEKQRVDVIDAVQSSRTAKQLVRGMARAAEAVSVSAVLPYFSTFQRFMTDVDAAVFQARLNSNTNNGVDFTNRPSRNLAAVEVLLDGTPHEVIRFCGGNNEYRADAPAGFVVEPRITISSLGYLNGWSAGGNPAVVWKTASNEIVLEGTVAGGTTTTLTQIARLPVGYRPTTPVVFACVNNDTTFASVGVDADGFIVFLAGTNVKLDLSGIHFVAAGKGRI